MPLQRCLMIAIALILATPFAPSRAADKATLLLNWYLYAEHAPFFLGKERGYFEREGIELDIQEGRGSVPTVQAVAAGTATFGYADLASILKAADKGAPVVVVGVLLQKSPMAFISLAEKNIRSLQDLRGRSLALTPGDSLSQILPLVLGKVGMKESDMTIIAGDNRAKLNAVINGQADAMLGYSMDQNLRIAAATHKQVRVLPFADYGVNLASSSIVTAKDTTEKHPNLVMRFMRAATRSVADAEQDPAAAVDAMLKVSPKAGLRDDLIEGLKLTVPLYHTDATKGEPPFRADRSDIKASIDLLAQSGTISHASAGRMDDFISFKFLPN